MLRVASTYVKSRASAEEVVQDAWLGVPKGFHLFEGRSSLKSWIFRILVNCAKTQGFRSRRSARGRRAGSRSGSVWTAGDRP